MGYQVTPVDVTCTVTREELLAARDTDSTTVTQRHKPPLLATT